MNAGRQREPRALAEVLHPRLVAVYRMLQGESSALGMSRTALSVLANLRDRGPQRISTLAAAERVAQPSMTALVRRLERQGWVTRTGDPADRRAVVAQLSPAGTEQLERFTRDSVRRLGDRLRALEPADRAALAAALGALDDLTRRPSSGTGQGGAAR